MPIPYVRHFLPLAILLLAIPPSRAAEERPNILWLVSEDNSPQYVGAYGNPIATTPNIDKIAAKGIRYNHAYTAPVCSPSRSSIITGRYASSMGTQHMRSERPLPEGVRFFPEYLRDVGYYCTNNAKTDYNTSAPFDAAWNESSNDAHWRQRKPGQPFFAVFNYLQSHESRLLQRFPLLTDPTKVKVPEYLPDTPAIRADIARYYDCVSRADEAIGETLAELEADGLADDTIIFYYSDHGGAVAGSKRFVNDAGTRAALIAYFPDKYKHLAPGAQPAESDELVHFIDLAPTVLSLAGIPLPEQFQGRAFAGPDKAHSPQYTYMFADRIDERYNLSRAVTDGRYRYIRNYYPDRPWGQFSDFLWRLTSAKDWELYFKSRLTSPAQSQFFQAQAAEALYDSKADPDNVQNLAADPAQQQQLEAMRQALREHILNTRDTGFLPEPSMIQMANGQSPTIVTRDASLYPLSEAIALIDAVQLKTSTQTAKLLNAAAQHSSPLIRYWAAVLASNTLESAFLPKLLTDPDPIVRIAAAESILHRDNHPAAQQTLEDAIIQTDWPELRHFAMDALARSPHPISDSLASTLGQLAASKTWGGIDYFLARLSRYILSDHGKPKFIQQLEAAADALVSPYPESAVFKGISLDWSTHQRHAPGSDNFQLTWADDNHLYGSWGDGGGFGGSNQKGRVDLGVARIEGDADNYRGFNVWGGFEAENPATFVGKSWGIISVGENLHMWTVPGVPPGKNYRNPYEFIELATSRDHSKTWQKSDWKFTQQENLIIPTFLNFGRANVGVPARMQGYVYSYFTRPESTDIEVQGPNARGNIVHKPGILYLARIDEKKLPGEKADFEFFTGLDSTDAPLWGSLAHKTPVFEDPNGTGWCLSASYHPASDRILLTTEHDVSHQGQFGIFDAPNPWGPWTTVEYYNRDEPFGATRSGSELPWRNNLFYLSFVPKWFDGDAFTISFTGSGRGEDNDSFNTVSGQFLTKE